MSKLKNCLLATAMAAAALGSASACAASFEIWNGTGWSNNGTTHFTGPVVTTYNGNTYPCNADWTVSIVGGVASVTNATYSGTPVCAGTAAQNLPWPVAAPSAYAGANPPFAGAPVLTAPLYNFTVSGYRTFVPAPLNMYCPFPTGTGTIAGVLDASNRLVFNSLVGACRIRTNSLIAPGALVANPAIRVVP